MLEHRMSACKFSDIRKELNVDRPLYKGGSSAVHFVLMYFVHSLSLNHRLMYFVHLWECNFIRPGQVGTVYHNKNHFVQCYIVGGNMFNDE